MRAVCTAEGDVDFEAHPLVSLKALASPVFALTEKSRRKY